MPFCTNSPNFNYLNTIAMNTLTISTALQIKKPVGEVYEAIVDPIKMSGYFLSEGSERMDAGAQPVWKFPEFEETFSINVIKTVPNERVVFEWEGAKDTTTKVEIELEPKPDGATLVRVREGELAQDETGIKWLKNNTEGWANFLACMKCYLEHGINLRTGGYDYLKK